MKKYYALTHALTTEGTQADIYIYGDIVSWPWLEGDVSSYNLAQEIAGLEVDTINVYINSYGGEVAEGLAIYNALRRHKARVRTYCDGFACSAASVVFMAGDERIMSNASLLMIHNAWTYTVGDQNQLRKDADDLEIITQASINAYMDHINITEEELKALMDAETWISANDALEMGFATSVVALAEKKAASQSVRKQLAELILKGQTTQTLKAREAPPEPEPLPEQAPEPAPEPEPPAQNIPQNLLAALFARKE
ncbi:MAG TPA: Clp protease ClpP [Bacillota bacterium]|nr:Clp protease ClpP [Bacillota bacterium]